MKPTQAQLDALLTKGFGCRKPRVQKAKRTFDSSLFNNKSVDVIILDGNTDGTITNPVYKTLLKEFPAIIAHYDAMFAQDSISLNSNFTQTLKNGRTIEVFLTFCRTNQWKNKNEDTGVVNMDVLEEGIRRCFEYADAMDLQLHVPRLCSGKGGISEKILEDILEANCSKYNTTCTYYPLINRGRRNGSK